MGTSAARPGDPGGELQQLRAHVAELERELALRRDSEEQRRSVFDSMYEGFAVCELVRDADGHAVDFRYLELNPAFARQTGLHAADVVGRLASEAVPGLSDWWLKTFIRLVETGETVRFEHLAEPLDRWYRVSAMPQGQDRFAFLYDDITTSKRAETAIRESQATLRGFYDSAPFLMGVVHLDGDRTIMVSQNRAVAEFLGVSLDELAALETPALANTPELERLWIESYRRSRHAGAPVQFDFEHAGPGATRWLRATVSFIGVGPAGHPRFSFVAEDITARKRVEDELRRTSNLLGAITKHSPDLVYAKDLDGRLAHVSESIATLLGRPARELLGKTDPEFLPDPEAGFAAAERDRRVRESGIPFVGEERLVLQSGEVRTYLTTKVPWRDDQFRLLGTFGFSVDITDRKRSEEALRESEERFRGLADNISQFAWMADATGWIFWYNRRWHEYTGTTAEEMQGWGWTKVHHPEHVDRVVAHIRNCFETGRPWEDTFPLRGKDGGYRWFLSRAVPIRDAAGRITRWFGTNTDITERLETEDRLRASEERFRRLYESKIIGIVSADTELVYEANDTFLDTIGCSREDLEAGRVRWRDFTAAEYLPADERGIAEMLETGSCKPFEKEYVRKDGSRVPVLLGAILLSRSPVRFLCFILDLTERKELESKLYAKQKLESIGLLAGGIAHDFNNLLVGVLGNASLAQEMAADGEPVAEVLEEIVKAAERAAHLTRQMLAYSGKGRFVIERVDLSEMVRDMTRLLHPAIPDCVEVAYDLPSGLPRVHGDPGQLQQVVMNLVLNAAEAIGESPGRIAIRTGRRTLEAAAIRQSLRDAEIEPGPYVFLEVRDTGCGMEDATVAKIFDPFFTTKFTGRGLGLAAVSGIVRGHRGAIEISTAPGRGSTFTVLFPAETAVEERAEVELPPSPLAEAPERGVVLVVDDEDIVRKTAKVALERGGHEVLVADGGPSAIDILRDARERVSIVLLDLSMPGMSGMQVLPRLRSIRTDLPVLVSSGYSERETMRMFGGERLEGFIQKPYTGAQLAAKIREVLAQQSPA